jgi:hypothetical protein
MTVRNQLWCNLGYGFVRHKTLVAWNQLTSALRPVRRLGDTPVISRNRMVFASFRTIALLYRALRGEKRVAT